MRERARALFETGFPVSVGVHGWWVGLNSSSVIDTHFFVGLPLRTCDVESATARLCL